MLLILRRSAGVEPLLNYLEPLLNYPGEDIAMFVSGALSPYLHPLMAQMLHIGLLERTPGWEMILEMLGLPWGLIHSVGEPPPEDFSVIIVNRHLWVEEREGIEGYIRAGGAVLDVARLLPGLRPWRCRRTWSSRILSPPSLDRPASPDVIDTGCRATEFDGNLIGLEELGAGTLAYLGFHPDGLMLKEGNRTKRFAGLDRRHPAELVSAVDKGEVVWLVDALLRRLYRERGLPYARKRPFPGDAPSITAFRIDTDYGTRDQMGRLYEISVMGGLPFTWFLHTDGHIGWLDRFSRFDVGEIALHCARHRTFRSREENAENIARAHDAMRRAGLPEPIGYAAPNGIWNHGVAEAIDEARFLYSSEFSLAFDTLPFRPALHPSRRINDSFYNALQIPIHPVSVGNLARVGISDEEMKSYYRRIIARKIALEQPLVFYHHPTHERFDVVEEIIAASLETGALPMTFAEYALWWRKREDARVALSTDDEGRLHLRSFERDPSVQIGVDYPDGSQGIIWMDGSYSKGEISSGISEPLAPPHTPVPNLRRFSGTVARRAIRDRLTRLRR